MSTFCYWWDLRVRCDTQRLDGSKYESPMFDRQYSNAQYLYDNTELRWPLEPEEDSAVRSQPNPIDRGTGAHPCTSEHLQ